MIEIALFIVAFFTGGRLGIWSMGKENDRLHHAIWLMQDQAKMHRRSIEDLKAEVLELRGEAA